MNDEFKNVVSTEWLYSHLDSPDIRIVDASWYFDHEKRNAEKEFQVKHIPGASFLNIDEVRDKNSSLPHMIPSAASFNSTVRSMGIGDGHKIVVYDGIGMRSAPRVWWMFRIFGVKDVVVLDGGLPKWESENRPVSNEIIERGERHFTIHEDRSILADKEDVFRATKLEHFSIVDARSKERFLGNAPEPRPGLRSGSIDTSLNVPYETLLNEDMTFKKKPELLALFRKANLELKNPIITSCGSGVTAAVLFLALEEIGCSKLALYDGSWAEWGLMESGNENG